MVAKTAKPYLGKIRYLRRLVTDIPAPQQSFGATLRNYLRLHQLQVSSTAWNASSMSAGSTQPM